MIRRSSKALALLPLLLLAACGSDSLDASTAPGRGSAVPGVTPDEDSSAAASRAVAEADIVQLEGGKLYALSKRGTLSVVDVSRPKSLTLLGQTNLPGEPFEMYLREGVLVVMVNGAYGKSGELHEPTIDARTGRAVAEPSVAVDRSSGAAVLTIDVSRSDRLTRIGTFPVPGEVADSRIVGDVLYLVTYQNASCYRCGASKQTVVTSFNVATPTAMQQVTSIAYVEAVEGYGWGEGSWKRAVYTSGTHLYVGGHAEATPSYYANTDGEGTIDVLDISDPAGSIVPQGRISTAGGVFSRWQMDEKDGKLRVVSQRGIGYMTNGIGSPYIETFTASGEYPVTSMVPIVLPRQEGLKTVRFDGDRAYAITFAETDPLFIIDLSGPEPKQRGELVMPGWVFHLEPRGDRLLGLGVDRRDPEGHLNVSLFDVGNMDHPRMLERVAFGNRGSTWDQQILDYELPEDQSRIQKAFRVLDDGLVVVPYANAVDASETCSLAGGVQLLAWRGDRLERKANLQVNGFPRRAMRNGGELLAVSDASVSSWDIASPDAAFLTADVPIGDCGEEYASAGWRQRPRSYESMPPMEDTAGFGPFGCAQSGGTGGGRDSLLAVALAGLLVGAGIARRSRETEKGMETRWRP